jgi:hypothetical protein
VEFVAARCRPNTVAATPSDLGVFFSVVDGPGAGARPRFDLGGRRPLDGCYPLVIVFMR